MSQQISGLLVVNSYIMICKCAWEEVVNLPGDIKDVTHPKPTQKNALNNK